VVTPKPEDQALSIQRGLALAKSIFHLVIVSRGKVYEVAVDVTDQRPGLDPDPVLSLYLTVISSKGDLRGTG
jgi:hypothetical protein